MKQVAEYKGMKFVSAESSVATHDMAKSSGAKAIPTDVEPLQGREVEDFSTWFKTALQGKIETVKTTSRPMSVPAMIVDHESGNVRRLMQMASGGM